MNPDERANGERLMFMDQEGRITTKLGEYATKAEVEAVTRRVEELETRFNAHVKVQNHNAKALERRLEAQEGRGDGMVTMLGDHLVAVQAQFKAVEARLGSLEAQFVDGPLNTPAAATAYVQFRDEVARLDRRTADVVDGRARDVAAFKAELDRLQARVDGLVAPAEGGLDLVRVRALVKHLHAMLYAYDRRHLIDLLLPEDWATFIELFPGRSGDTGG